MKKHNPGRMMPNLNQLYSFVHEKLSTPARQSISWEAVSFLYGIADSNYRALNFYTSEGLATFVSAEKYLTSSQEHDLVALTAAYILSLDISKVQRIIDQDSVVNNEERVLLKSAVDLFKNTAEATCNALGNPGWVDE